jgi:hypothetical protein
MSVPKVIGGYEKEWSAVAMTLTEKGELLLPVGDARRAKELRLRFYGFRKALGEHDAGNPWVAALMETRATITGAGDLFLQRGYMATLLRGVLEHSEVVHPVDVGDGRPTVRTDPLLDVLVDIGMVKGGEDKAS